MTRAYGTKFVKFKVLFFQTITWGGYRYGWRCSWRRGQTFQEV